MVLLSAEGLRLHSWAERAKWRFSAIDMKTLRSLISMEFLLLRISHYGIA
jgi:hypothetical protein